jgi:hypothetical protein
LEKTIEERKITTFDPECVRKKSNIGKSINDYKFDTLDFSPDTLLNDVKRVSPKLAALLKKIKDLDKKDMQKHGKLFKHFVFSDLKSSSAGAKLLASGLIANGFHCGYTAKEKENAKKKKFGPLEFLSDTDLLKTKNKNLYLLCSGGVYDQPISVAMKKAILQKFNQRPENINGELIRIMVMDSGFKEGIDLFDIKYVHIFEPSVVAADQKQVIGRGTRTCGQKGLEFHPTRGWPLNVFIYDLEFHDKLKGGLLGTSTAMELYLKSMNLDIRQLNFSHDLEKTCVVGSVDYDLNKNVHLFSIPDEDAEEDLPEGAEFIYGGAKRQTLRKRHDLPPLIVNTRADGSLELLIGADGVKQKGHEETKQYINENFSQFAWNPVKMENLCVEKQAGGGNLLTYTPTQDFVRHYFTPENPLKGMLLWHSVGTGKTCTAIATATSTFEKQNYTILWVTRTTLKNDIWKNMFEQVCNENIRDRMDDDTFTIPSDMKKRMKLISKSWRIRPMSYKQFSNLVAKKNAFYKTLVKMNGEADPLHKTLLIIDEAHKLYGGGLSEIEQPDMDAFHRAVMKSYSVSGKNSVKLLLMTATPVARQPMEMIQLINLFKSPYEQIEHQFDAFRRVYLEEDGTFSQYGRERFLNEIAGHISYLNREKDARQFSQPIIKSIEVPIVENLDDVEKFDKKVVRQYVESDIEALKNKIVENNEKLQGEMKDVDKNAFGHLKEKCQSVDEPKLKKECDRIVKSNIRELVAEAKEHMTKIKESIKELREQIKNRNLFKKDAMADVANNREQFEEEFKDYKNTPYYQMRSKCAKVTKAPNYLQENMKQHPTVIEYDMEIALANERIDKLQLSLKNDMEIYKARVQKIKKLLKTNLSDLERSVVKMVLKDEQKTMRAAVKMKKKELVTSVQVEKKAIKQTMKKRQKIYLKLRKTLKKTISEEKKNAKKIKKAEEKLRKTLRKQEGFRQEFKDDTIKGLANKYAANIDSEIEKARSELLGKESAKLKKAADKVAEKEAKKQQKIADRETRKREKAAEKEARKQTRKKK